MNSLTMQKKMTNPATDLPTQLGQLGLQVGVPGEPLARVGGPPGVHRLQVRTDGPLQPLLPFRNRLKFTGHHRLSPSHHGSRGIVKHPAEGPQPALEQAMAKNIGATVVTLPSSHVPQLSHPKAVADAIIAAASR